MNYQNTVFDQLDIDIMKNQIEVLSIRINKTLDIASMIHFNRTYKCSCHTNRDYGPNNCCSCKYVKVAQSDLDIWARRHTEPLQAERAELLTKVAIAERDLEAAKAMMELCRDKSGEFSEQPKQEGLSEKQKAAIEHHAKTGEYWIGSKYGPGLDDWGDTMSDIDEYDSLIPSEAEPAPGPQSGECMIGALDEVIGTDANDTEEDEAFNEALRNIFPIDENDEFVEGAQNAQSSQENPITFFLSTGGHMVERTLAHYWDEVLTIESTSTLRQYIDAMELGMPHLKTDILEWILFKTRGAERRPWDEKYLVRQVIDLAREHFVTKVANSITARARMGINDLNPQAGMINIWKGVQNCIKGQETQVYQGVQLAMQTEWPAVAGFMENVVFFHNDWKQSKTSTDCIISVYRFFKAQFNFSLSANMAHWMIQLIEELGTGLATYQEEALPPFEGGVEPQAGFGEFLDTYKQVTRSSVFEKISKLAMLIASLAMCTMTGSTLTSAKFTSVCKAVYDGLRATDILGQIMEAIQAVYKKCIPVLLGKAEFSSMFIGLGDGKQLDLDILDFIKMGTRYADGTANADDKSPDVMLIEVIDIVRRLNELMAATQDKVARGHLKRTILQVEQVRQTMYNRHNNAGMRAAPFTISINGPSGVGKTALNLELIAALQISEGLPAGPKYVYRMDDEDSYQSGINSQHNTYVIDDYGNTRPDFAKVIPTNLIIQLANNCPKFAVMADLAAKGSIPMKPYFLVITTNVKHLHAKTYSECKESILRRPNFHITMTVRARYADSEGKLREDVDPVAEGYDCWIFTIEKYMPHDERAIRGFVSVEYQGEYMENVSFNTLIRFLVAQSKIHHGRQRRYVEHTNNVHTVPRCECGLPERYCTGCEFTPQQGPQPQAGWFEPERKILNTYLGVRQVMQTPLGRELLAEKVKYLACAWMLKTAFLLVHGFTSAAMMMWLLGTLLFFAVSVYRIATYRISMDVQPAVENAVASLRDVLLGNKAKVVAALIGAASVYYLYKKYDKPVPQGSTPSRPRVNFEVSKVPDNWRRTEVTPLPKNSDTTDSTGKQLAESLKNRICTVSVYTDTVHRYAAAIPVVTNFWLVPYHLIREEYKMVKIQRAGGDVINNSHTTIREGSYERIGKTDFALLYMPGKGDQKNILEYFPTSQVCNETCRYVEKPCRLVLLEQEIQRVPDTDRNIMVPKSSVHGVRVSSNHVSPNGIEPYWGGTYTSPVDTFTGMCGSILVAEGNGPYIVGVHSAGIVGKKHASYCALTREAIQECIVKMTAPDEPMMQGSDEGPMNLDFEQMPFKHELPKNNHFEYIDNAEVDIVGCHAGRKRRYTTMVRATDYSDAVAEKFKVERMHGPPALMNHWYPARLWAESCANSKPMDMFALRYAFKSFRKKVFDHLARRENDKEDICVLEDIVNTSGLDGVKGLFKMNLNASAGIPYCKPKKDYVKASLDFFDGITVPYELTDEMKADVKILEDIYKSGARGYAPHRANRKDEAIKIGKAKVRIFSGTSMPYLFLMRKYFLTISVYMQRHPEVFESAVGTNPYSSEWTKLHKYITKHGIKRIVAGDYEKYDQFVHSMLTYAAFKLLMQIAEWAGFDEEDLMVMRGLATDTCNPLYELDGLWLKFGGSSPSGHGLTVVLNGIVNSFYARMAWFDIQEEQNLEIRLPIASFNKLVAFMSYGDDNIMSVSDEADWFNHCTYQKSLAKYGLNYTMADKTAESVPYISMDEANFLKRKWVYSEKYGRYLAPLELDSIYKMLHTFVVSKVSPKEQQLADILRSANQEFFMHGEEAFASARDKLVQIASEYELSHYLPGGQLPDLEEMDSWYREM